MSDTVLFDFGAIGGCIVVSRRYPESDLEVGTMILNGSSRSAQVADRYRACNRARGFTLAPHEAISFGPEIGDRPLYVRVGRICRRVR